MKGKKMDTRRLRADGKLLGGHYGYPRDGNVSPGRCHRQEYTSGAFGHLAEQPTCVLAAPVPHVPIPKVVAPEPGRLNRALRRMMQYGYVAEVKAITDSIRSLQLLTEDSRRLLELALQGSMPSTVQQEFVRTIACCRIGNGYGVSNAAVRFYDQMIRNFSPREILILLRSATSRDNSLGMRVSLGGSYRDNFKKLLELIDVDSVPNVVKPLFDRFRGAGS